MRAFRLVGVGKQRSCALAQPVVSIATTQKPMNALNFGLRVSSGALLPRTKQPFQRSEEAKREGALWPRERFLRKARTEFGLMR